MAASDLYLDLGIDPGFGAAVRLLAVAVDLTGPVAPLDEALAAAAEHVRATPVAQVPAIQATRVAYKRLGKDPSRYRPAAEALWRRIAKGEALPRPAPLVDLNTWLSLTTGMAVGVYDRDRLTPPLRLREGAPGETYPAIGGQGAFNLEHLPLLVDEAGPFGSPTRDGERARVTAATTRALFVLFDFGGTGELAPPLVHDWVAPYLPAAGIATWQVTHAR